MRRIYPFVKCDNLIGTRAPGITIKDGTDYNTFSVIEKYSGRVTELKCEPETSVWTRKTIVEAQNKDAPLAKIYLGGPFSQKESVWEKEPTKAFMMATFGTTHATGGVRFSRKPVLETGTIRGKIQHPLDPPIELDLSTKRVVHVDFL